MKRHLLKFLFFFSLVLCSSAVAVAQRNVKGQIVDSETGEPLIGAAVMVKETSQGTVTDIDGNFTQTVPANGTLLITYVGFKDWSKKITQKGNVNLGEIRMEADAIALADVTITSSVAKARRCSFYSRPCFH